MAEQKEAIEKEDESGSYTSVGAKRGEGSQRDWHLAVLYEGLDLLRSGLVEVDDHLSNHLRAQRGVAVRAARWGLIPPLSCSAQRALTLATPAGSLWSVSQRFQARPGQFHRHPQQNPLEMDGPAQAVAVSRKLADACSGGVQQLASRGSRE